jgi:penicillin-binding protein-related factor A (putative recombinase)
MNMEEKDLNKYVADSLSRGYKIPDPPQMASTTSNKRPFDGFGAWNGKVVFWESKFAKKLKAFDLSRIADHQAEALDGYSQDVDNCYCWAVFGIHVGRSDFRVWIFDWKCIRDRYYQKSNILLKELIKYPYHKVQKKKIELDDSKIITELLED